MQAYILLDRSGSMQSLWVEALSSVNAFAKELANRQDGPAVDSHITSAPVTAKGVSQPNPTSTSAAWLTKR